METKHQTRCVGTQHAVSPMSTLPKAQEPVGVSEIRRDTSTGGESQWIGIHPVDIPSDWNTPVDIKLGKMVGCLNILKHLKPWVRLAVPGGGIYCLRRNAVGYGLYQVEDRMWSALALIPQVTASTLSLDAKPAGNEVLPGHPMYKRTWWNCYMSSRCIEQQLQFLVDKWF